MRKILGFWRKNWKSLVFDIGFSYATINFAFGKRSIIDWIIMILFGIDLILKLTIILVKPVGNRVVAYKIVKIYKQGFNSMKKAHQLRYRLYFTSNANEIEKYSNWIKDIGSTLIDYGEDELTQEVLSKKQQEYVTKSNTLVRQMLTTENPNMIKGLL